MAKYQPPQFKSSTYEVRTLYKGELFQDLDSAKKVYHASPPPKSLNWYDEKGRPTQISFMGAKSAF